MKRRNQQSRLNRMSEKQNKRQALFFTVGIIVLIIVLIQFGPFLINVFGNVVYTIRGGDKNETQLVGNELLQPPTLFGVPEATRSAEISFNGSAPNEEGVVELYVNNDLAKEIALNGKKDFETEEIDIEKGANTIKARFVAGDKTSAFSKEYIVNFINAKPKLEIDSPQNEQRFTRADKSITVMGTTDPDNTITVNSFRAIVDFEGKFSYLLQLADGDNQISVVAQNSAGVTTQKDIKVTYNP